MGVFQMEIDSRQVITNATGMALEAGQLRMTIRKKTETIGSKANSDKNPRLTTQTISKKQILCQPITHTFYFEYSGTFLI
jgi:hypothetical protein